MHFKIKVENNEIKIDEVSNNDAKKDDKKINKEDGVQALSSDEDTKDGKKDKKFKKSKKKKSKKEKKKKVRIAIFFLLYPRLQVSRNICLLFFFQKKRKKGKDSENSGSQSEESGTEEHAKKLKSVLKQNVAYPSSSTGESGHQQNLIRPFTDFLSVFSSCIPGFSSIPTSLPAIPATVVLRSGATNDLPLVKRYAQRGSFPAR